MPTLAVSRIARAIVVLGLLLGIALAAPGVTLAMIRTVSDCGDAVPLPAHGQLRALLAAAVDGDVIVIPACTITLAPPNGPLIVAGTLTLQGAGAAHTTLQGGGMVQVIVVPPSNDVTLGDLTVRDGYSPDSGGGILSLGGQLTLRRVVVTENQAGLYGAGVRSSGPLLLVDTVVSNNMTTRYGGGIYALDRLTLVRSTVSGNRATDSSGGAQGGGIFIDADRAHQLINSTVSGNHAAGLGGGGLQASKGVTTLLSSTITDNHAPHGSGGGLASVSAPILLRNTIVAGNTAAHEADCFATIASTGHNLDGDGSCHLGQPGDRPGTDPKLGPLQDNGGPTPTHALLAGSPAIDAGDPLGCPLTDQRGRPRPHGAGCDIGAFESRTLGTRGAPGQLGHRSAE